jgi:nicotinate-nucleotide adenylyltransferase
MVKSEAEQKTGIFGGTFNPFHMGHLNAAESVFNTLGLKEIIFIPVYIPPHKGCSSLESSVDRIEIIKKSIEGRTCFNVSDLEIKRKGLSYTIDTLEEIRISKNRELVFIMGSDSFLKTASIAVVSRPGFEPDIKCSGVEGYYLKNKGHYLHRKYKDIYFIKINETDISSTDIREMIKKKKNIRAYIHEKAADYIEEKGLYKNEK